MLGQPVRDLDLAVEGDGVAFGKALARPLGARPRVHERFGTVALELGDGSRVDVASTRAETYESRGALPRVTPAPLARDLARRDFTINAMAIRLVPGRPALLDPLGGARDIEKKLVRMLHRGSPVDDPTRALRAVRYANRLGFRIEARTRGWIDRAVRTGAFEAVSGDRLRRELRLLFAEENRARAVALLCSLGLERGIDPVLSCGPGALRSLRRAEKIAARHPGMTGWLLYLLAWAGRLKPAQAEALARRLSLAGEERKRLLGWPAALAQLRREATRITPSRALASGFSADEVAAAAALGIRGGGRRLENILDALETRLSIRGRDLIAAGVPAGPRIGRALEVTLRALRDGRVSRQGELAFAVRAALREAS